MSLKEILKRKAKCLVWRNMTGAQSHTCTQAADECVPSINNEGTITEKSLLNTLFFSRVAGHRRHITSTTTGPTAIGKSRKARLSGFS